MNGSRLDFPDEDLRFRVESFLKSRHFPAFEELEIDVHNGSVTLTGLLRSYYEKQVAMNSCQRVAGVVALIDQINVKSHRQKKLKSLPEPKKAALSKIIEFQND